MAGSRMEYRNAGFSLVELMVGMVLGLILIAGAVSIYLATKRSYVEVEQVAALTENSRFAEQIIGDSLRQAGFFGEVTGDQVEVDSNLNALVNDCTTAGAGYGDLSQFVFAATATGSNDLGCITGALAGTDILVVKHVRAQPLTDGPRDSSDPNNPTHGDGVIDTPHGLQAEKTYVISNNVVGRLFDGADTQPSIGLGGQIPSGSAWEYQYEVFYIRDAEIPQLSRMSLHWNGTDMELQSEDVAEGVENLRVLLGFDGDGDGEVDTYKDAAYITANDKWSDVESLEVYLLVRSAEADAQYVDEKDYSIPGVSPGTYQGRLSSLHNLRRGLWGLRPPAALGPSARACTSYLKRI